MLEPQTQPPADLTVDGIAINVPSLPAAVSSIVSAAQHGDNFSVCTLNLDHVVQLRNLPDFRAAYRRARFVTADGFPIVILGRLLGTPIERTTGADLVEPVCQEAGKKHLPVFLLGSDERTLAKTAERLSARFKGLRIAGCFAPGPNFEPYSEEADIAVERIRASGAKLCFVALGAPRQELFAARCLDELDGTGMLCVGAALEFIAGTQTRAPTITQKTGLEWAWRMLSEPRRLGPRYARCMAAVPQAPGADHAANCQRTYEESGMTSTLTLSLRARNANRTQRRYQICLIHPFDPRGEKVGGLETYIRDFITFHPADTDLLFIGVDSAGRPDARQSSQTDFPWPRLSTSFPILHYPDQHAREAARSIRSSLTGQFFMALMRHFGLIAKLVRARQCSIDLRRVEFSWLPAILRLPFVQMLHGEGAPKLQMDSLLRKYSFVHNTGERFAVAMSEKFLCVNPFITERLQKTYPRRKDKIDTLWTWVNTDIFKPQPMPEST